MNDNILTNGKVTVIINGGNPLEGCPKSWDEAETWQEKANEGKDDFDQESRLKNMYLD